MGWRQRFTGSGSTNRAVRGMATLAMGSVAARVIGLLTVPVLTRLYTPADYGVLSAFNGLVQILIPIITLRYVMATPLPKNDAMAFNVLVLSAGIATTFLLLITPLLGLFGGPLLGAFGMEILTPWWWLLVVALGMAAVGELLSSWATRKRAYKMMARHAVISTLLGEGSKVGFGLLGLKPFGLLFGNMIAQTGGVAGFAVQFAGEFRRNCANVTLARVYFLACYYRAYPIYRLPSQFLLVLSMQAPLLFTAGIYGLEASGQLGLALMTLAMPSRFLGDSVGKAYYAEAARIGRRQPGELLRLTKAVQKRLFVIAIPPTAILMFFGPSLFSFAFGEQWRTAGTYASMLSVYTLLQLTSAPLMQILNIFNNQAAFLIINASRAVLVLALTALCSNLQIPVERYVQIYAFLMVFFYLAITIAILILVARYASASKKDEKI